MSFVAISQDDAADTREFCKEYGITFRRFWMKQSYPASNEYGITNVPTYYLIAPDGNVQVASVGFSKRAFEAISEYLARVLGMAASSVFLPGEIVREIEAGLRVEELGSGRGLEMSFIARASVKPATFIARASSKAPPECTVQVEPAPYVSARPHRATFCAWAPCGACPEPRAPAGGAPADSRARRRASLAAVNFLVRFFRGMAMPGGPDRIG